MKYRFTKMHGIGNDFVVLDARSAPPGLNAETIRAIGDRRTGVGFDQLLTIEAPRDPTCAYYYGIWNRDGSRSGQCGNGVRCVAAWLHRAGALAAGDMVRLESPSGPVAVRVEGAGDVSVDMSEPVFAPALVPFEADAEAETYPIEVAGELLSVGAVSLGNPHAVVEVASVDAPALDRLGPALTAHPRFPAQVNAGFVEQIGRDHLRLRVHERGAGWTLACGTGACAAMAVLRRRGAVGEQVHVDLPGGRLAITWPGPGHTLWMRGPAAFVFEGEWLG